MHTVRPTHRLFYRVTILLLVFTLLGCNNHKKTVKQSIETDIIRFEQQLFNLDFDTINRHIDYLQHQHPSFFPLYFNKVLRIGPVDTPAFPASLQNFLSDYTIHLAYTEVKTVFEDFSAIEEQIKTNLGNYQHLLPSVVIPAVYTCLSGFNQSIILGDSVLAIALDKYLGRDCFFYRNLNWYQYQIKNMYKEKIPSDCIYALALTDFPISEEAVRLIDHMLYYGKALYLTKQACPGAHDTLILGFTERELAFCHEFEKRMWTFLVEQKMLFSTDMIRISQFTEEGPFTKFFGNDSPAKAANWIGMRIIESYMRRNTEVTPAMLMEDNNYSEILRGSAYNPR